MLKNKIKTNAVMSVVLLLSITIIACNMDKVATIETKNKEKNSTIKNGYVVVIDPGHGGYDPGKVGINNIKEKDINLAIASSLQDYLLNIGFDVVMTRESDCQLGEGEAFSKIKDLNKRCSIINNTYRLNTKCIMISIHQNSFTNSSVEGAQTFFYKNSKNSETLAQLIQKNLNNNINNSKEKTAKSDTNYYMLINSHCPGVIIECGFLSNPDEAKKLSTANYQQQLAKIICQGICEYFDVSMSKNYNLN